MRLLSDGIGSGLLCWLLKADIFLSICVKDIAPEKTARVASTINWWSGKMFPFAIGACLVILLFDVDRIIRIGRNSHRNELLNTVYAPTRGACGIAANPMIYFA